MIDKVLCPYCGHEMENEDWVNVGGKYLSYAVCSNDACQSFGPTVTGYETMAEARAAALAAVRERYLTSVTYSRGKYHVHGSTADIIRMCAACGMVLEQMGLDTAGLRWALHDVAAESCRHTTDRWEDAQND